MESDEILRETEASRPIVDSALKLVDVLVGTEEETSLSRLYTSTHVFDLKHVFIEGIHTTKR